MWLSLLEFLKERKPHSVEILHTQERKNLCSPGSSPTSNTNQTLAMADPPPSLPTPTSLTKVAKGKGVSLPDSSRFPVLASEQVSFTTTAAIKDIELVPQHVYYRIQFDLRSRIRDKIFKDAPWTLIARHFFSIMQLHGEKAIIV